MCRVIVPFTRLEDGVLEALEAYDVEFCDVSSDDEAYWRLLRDLWASGDSFTIIEQDIRIKPDTIDSFDDCDNDWCAAGYRYLGSDRYTGLGCTRFRGAFTRRFPNIIEIAGEFRDNMHPRRHWCVQDAAIQFALRDRGQHACTAHGTVEHLGDCRPSHGCCG